MQVKKHITNTRKRERKNILIAEKALLATILETTTLVNKCKELGLYLPANEVLSIYNKLSKELKEEKEKK